MKPKLLLDIDGVLCPFGYGFDPNGFVQYSFKTKTGRIAKVFCSEDNRERLRLLQPHFDIIWATHWEEYANQHCQEFFGLSGDYENISFQMPIGDPDKDRYWVEYTLDTVFMPDDVVTLKLAYIDAWHRENQVPFAWIDDSIEEDVHDWAKERDDVLLITPRSEIGLTDEHVDSLIEFALDFNKTGNPT